MDDPRPNFWGGIYRRRPPKSKRCVMERFRVNFGCVERQRESPLLWWLRGEVALINVETHAQEASMAI